MHFKLSPLIVWIALWIMNAFSEFQVNVVSNNGDDDNDADDDDLKAIAIPRVFPKTAELKMTKGLHRQTARHESKLFFPSQMD